MKNAIRTLVIKGWRCETRLTRDGKGFGYEVRRWDGPNTLTLIAQGWSAGTLAEALGEAESHAAAAL